MSQLQQIKSLSNELSENALFNYSKRGILILMEILGYLISIGSFVGGLLIAVWLPSYEFDNGIVISAKIPELQSILILFGVVFILLSFLSMLITRYLRRTRRKKAQVYELTQLIKNL